MNKDLYYIQDTRTIVGNCVLWWRPNRLGYTTDLNEAGRYTQKEALAQHRSRDTDVPWLCSEIEPLVRRTIDFQYVHYDVRSMDEQIAALAKLEGAE